MLESANTGTITKLLYETGREDLIERYVNPMTRGDRLGGFAWSEGNDPFAFRTRLEQTARGYVLDGRKGPVANGQIADVFMVFVRDVPTLLQSLIFPALSMVMFKVVLGDAIGKATGQDSAYGTVPLVILVGAMFGSIASATRINQERSTGLLARLYVLPINRAADLTSRVAAELIRISITTLILLAAGTLIGFRFTQGVGPGIGLVGVALAYGAAYSTLTLALAVNFRPGALSIAMPMSTA